MARIIQYSRFSSVMDEAEERDFQLLMDRYIKFKLSSKEHDDCYDRVKLFVDNLIKNAFEMGKSHRENNA